MTANQIKAKLYEQDKNVKTVAEELGTSSTIISQLINGHNFYPRYAREMRERYGVVIHDFRRRRRQPKTATAA